MFLTEDMLMADEYISHKINAFLKLLTGGWMDDYTATWSVTANLQPPQKNNGSGGEISLKASASHLATR